MTNSLEEEARAVAGNWRSFRGFAWGRPEALDQPDDWCLVYTHHRDSCLTDQSNAAAIDEALTPHLAGGTCWRSPISTGRWGGSGGTRSGSFGRVESPR